MAGGGPSPVARCFPCTADCRVAIQPYLRIAPDVSSARRAYVPIRMERAPRAAKVIGVRPHKNNEDEEGIDSASMKHAIRVLLVGRHRILTDGLHALFRKGGEFKVVGQCSDGPTAREAIARLKPGVVVVDVLMQACGS
jgi:hypothetical protein